MSLELFILKLHVASNLNGSTSITSKTMCRNHQHASYYSLPSPSPEVIVARNWQYAQLS